MKRLALIGFLLLAMFLIVPAPAGSPVVVKGQGFSCSSYDFPQSGAGWTANTGTADVPNTSIYATGSGTIVIDAQIDFDTPVYVTEVKYQTYASPHTNTRHEVVLLYDPNHPADPPSDYSRSGNVDVYPDITLPFWRTTTLYFNGVATSSIQFVITQDSGSLIIGLHVVQICVTGSTIVTTTPSPTISPTPSRTPTPAPTHSPTPSNTPVVSDTPEPTSTAGPTSTATGSNNNHTGDFIFNTVVPPDQCASITNPCGAMPFPVPGFNNVNIASPTGIASITAAASGTLAFTMTPNGTPAGTVGPGTPTPGPGDGDAIAAYATGINEQLNNVQMTPGLIDPNGNLIDLRNTANELGGTVGQFFGILKALQSFFLGKTGNIIAILILIAGFVITVKLLLWMLPIIRAIAMFIVGFIP